MVDKYLRELVQNNHRVIIPDFGAFLKKDKSAASLADAITFSPFLRFNDGLLEDYLVDKGRIAKEEAATKVREYVQNVKEVIAGHRPYYVDDLGAFYEDERGSVQFLYAESEAEARRRFEQVMALAKVITPTFMPEMDVKSAPAAAVAPKPKAAAKDDGEVVEAEEVKAEEVKTVNARGRKKVEVKEVKAGKASRAVSKTIVNVNVTTDKGKEEPPRTDKEKQLEDASSSLQRWMAEVEKRKGLPAEDRNAALPVQATPEELEAQRRRQEEVERALEKKRHDGEAARERDAMLPPAEAQQPLPAVWEEEVIERRRGSRGAVLLLVLLALVLAGAGALWFWDDMGIAIWGGDSEPDMLEVTAPARPVVEPSASDTFIPVFLAQQPGLYYVVVGTFDPQRHENAISICRVLHRAGYTPEIIKSSGNRYSISVGKFRSAGEARAALERYSQKYGKAWIMPNP